MHTLDMPPESSLRLGLNGIFAGTKDVSDRGVRRVECNTRFRKISGVPQDSVVPVPEPVPDPVRPNRSPKRSICWTVDRRETTADDEVCVAVG